MDDEIQEMDLNKELDKAVLRAKENLDGFDKQEFLSEKQEDTTPLIEEIDDENGSKMLPILLVLGLAGGVFYTIWRIRKQKNGTA
jgi:hypothetical protein